MPEQGDTITALSAKEKRRGRICDRFVTFVWKCLGCGTEHHL
jgi:hypothetical protein